MAATVSGGLHASRDSFYRTARIGIQGRSGVIFDADINGSGQQAAHSLACRLTAQGINVRTVALPGGHDPNSFFVQGGEARQFQSLLEAAQ